MSILILAPECIFGKWVISEWYMPLHWGAGWKIDWTSCRGCCYHSGAVLIWTSNPGGDSIRLVPLSHAVDYDFGICGISMSDIAISSIDDRQSFERARHRPKKIHPCPWMHVWSHWCPDFRYMLVFVVPHPPLTLLPLPPGLHCNLTWNLLFYVHGGSHSDVSWTTIWPAL